MSSQRGFSEEQVQEAKERLQDSLSRLERQLEDKDYLIGDYTLADIAHAGNFHRLRELAERGEASLEEYPGVAAWMERLESRDSYEAAV